MTLSIPQFHNARVLVIGDIMLDRYWSGGAKRISPEAPVPVVKIDAVEDRLGGAANVAKNLAALGCDTSLCGIIGSDDAGKIVLELLSSSNIQSHIHTAAGTPTITKLRVLCQHQQLLRMDFEEALPSITTTDTLKGIGAEIVRADIVVISDYAKGTVSDCAPIITLCKQHHTPVIVDPKGSNFARYHGATLITPNLGELEGVVGTCSTVEQALERAEALREDLQLEAMLVTLSEKGMALIRAGRAPLHIPTEAQEVFDVTGAGDTVIATFAGAFAAGADMPTAMKIANIAAGIAVAKIGTATVTTDEIVASSGDQNSVISHGICNLENLTKMTRLARQKGETIVFTNGCFDILHAGHVRYLQQAAALGDRLVIGVNSDDSIKRLKGESRPVVPLQERMELLAALDCVDWVTSFSEDTPANLITAITPDYLVKGGDYDPKLIVGYDTVTNSGGKVVVMPFVQGCSTSSIIERIRKSL